MDIEKIIEENKKRLAEFEKPYDQLTGLGSLVKRREITYNGLFGDTTIYLPETMFENKLIQNLAKYKSIKTLIRKSIAPVTDENIEALENHIATLRLKHDFEFWAITCATIQDKKTKRLIKFKLNRPQRRLVAKLEELRTKRVPIRIIILKARQWGGSTLVQLYMAWIQLMLKKSWHSAIIADVEEQARNIRNMYDRLIKNYPKELGKLTWKPFAGSVKSKVIDERNCIIGLGSAQKPDSLRSFDFSMLHQSEVGLWRDTQLKTAEDLAQSLQATVPDEPDTLVCLESTAKGVGNYFHKRWLDASTGDTAFVPFFVPWFEIENYQKKIPDPISFIKSWGEYEHFLWELGATLEGIYWYVTTKKDYGYDDWRMNSEYPSTATEAFQSSGRRVFAPSYVLNARKTCKPPMFVGDIFPQLKGPECFKDIRFESLPKGKLFIWAMPDSTIEVTDRYVVSMDIGGRTDKADYSVIKVFDRYWLLEGGVPEVVAVWHGHIDQDLGAWKAAQIARFYNNAELIVEVNSLDRKSEGDHHFTVLDEIVDHYENLYARGEIDKITQGVPLRYGFHTNRKTKPMVIDTLNALLRDLGYIERDARACDEMDSYEVKADGSYGAVDGEHDDHVMVTAIGLWRCYDMPLPRIITQAMKIRPKRKIVSEASI